MEIRSVSILLALFKVARNKASAAYFQDAVLPFSFHHSVYYTTQYQLAIAKVLKNTEKTTNWKKESLFFQKYE